MRKSRNVVESRDGKKIVVKNEKPDQVPVEVLAQSITDVAEAAQKLLSGPLKKRAVMVLIKDACNARVSLGDIDLVLSVAADLKKYYLR